MTSHTHACVHTFTSVHTHIHTRSNRATLLLLKYQVFISHSNAVFYNQIEILSHMAIPSCLQLKPIPHPELERLGVQSHCPLDKDHSTPRA